MNLSFILSLPEKSHKIYNATMNFVFGIILFFITLTLIIGTVRMFFRVGGLIHESGITGSYLYIFTDVLTLFILIELARSLFEYFTSKRIRLVFIIDAGIVFILRHIMIELFNHKLDAQTSFSLGFLLLVLGIIRIGSTLTYNREIQMLGDENKNDE